MGIRRALGILRKGLAKTRGRIAAGIRSVASLGRKIDADFLEELEEVLIMADVGPRAAGAICARIEEAYKAGEVKGGEEILPFLKEHLKTTLAQESTGLAAAETPPTVVLVAWVNGTVKTTSVGKLAHRLRGEGKKVIVCAADTFRAAAVEQLDVWAKRSGAEIVRHQTGADPAAVVFDGCDAAVARGADVLLVDTAGRLHTKENLMRELEKIRRVVARKVPGAPHEVLLVLDATTGQNAVVQAKQFAEAIQVTGLFVAKLDGTAKGGAVLGMQDEVRIPVKFVGVGEALEDIEAFDADAFVEALFDTGGAGGGEA
jgi:fused signal recognition particle receptor